MIFFVRGDARSLQDVYEFIWSLLRIKCRVLVNFLNLDITLNFKDINCFVFKVRGDFFLGYEFK